MIALRKEKLTKPDNNSLRIILINRFLFYEKGCITFGLRLCKYFLNSEHFHLSLAIVKEKDLGII